MIESKSAFARRTNVTPGRVSQWIAQGKIGQDALEGDGRGAKIKIDLALEHLRRRLSLVHSLANGLSTNLLDPVAAPMLADDPVKCWRLKQVDRALHQVTDSRAHREIVTAIANAYESALAFYVSALGRERGHLDTAAVEAFQGELRRGIPTYGRSDG